ncbi:MAG: UDP-N-acetylmuramoyl-L-alanine--D-glutamate ligase [bacterium]
MNGKTIVVVGLARSGCAVGALLRRHGARVIGVDDSTRQQVEDRWQAEQLTELAPTAFDEIICETGWPQQVAGKLDGVALSPGVPRNHPGLQSVARSIPLLGELEWAARFCRATCIAITGTNGKSTTTELVAHLARAAGWRAEALGNVGRPLSLLADELTPDDLAVLEVSSFQLETIDRFRPRVGLVLNLAPDHLDRYPDLQAYYETKLKLADAVADDGRFVTWTGCPEALAWPTNQPPLLFGQRGAGAAVYWENDRLWIDDGQEPWSVVSRDEFPLPSDANLINSSAAVAALLPLQPERSGLTSGLASFSGLPHRQQIVAKLGAVSFIDDSKATNVAAVCAGLAGYADGVILIAGGRGKGEDYRPLRDSLGVVSMVIVIGEQGPAIAEALTGTVTLERADSLAAAVQRASELAQPDGTVLLSPACASFDMFRNYHERGNAFARAAVALGATAVAAAGEENG